MYSPEFKKNEVMLQNTSDGPLARQPGPTYKSIGHECRLSAISTPVAFPKHTIIKTKCRTKNPLNIPLLFYAQRHILKTPDNSLVFYSIHIYN